MKNTKALKIVPSNCSLDIKIQILLLYPCTWELLEFWFLS